MPQYVVTPWKYHRELVQVRKELYQLGDSTPEDRRHGIELVHAWALRGHIPHAVESTAILVDAILHHESAKNSSFSVRATYSAAFSRFVTGFCDIGQTKSQQRSMLMVAREIDMPAAFVELRHEATHEELPALVRLSRSSKLALEWLWQYYWAKIDEDGPLKLEDAQSQIKNTEDLQSALNTFLKARLQEIRGASKAVATTTEPTASDIACRSLFRICKGVKENLIMLATLLVKEKMLVPGDRSLNDSMAGAFQIWTQLLKHLAFHQRSFFKTLITHMLSVLAAATRLDMALDAFRQALYEWLLQFFTAETFKRVREREEWSLREAVLKVAVVEPNCWLVPLAKRVFENASVDFKGQWRVHIEAL